MAPTYISRRLSYHIDNKQLVIDEAGLLDVSAPKIILGEPGMGKTRLISSLAAKLGVKAVSASRFMRQSAVLQGIQSGKPLLIDSVDEAIASDECAAVDEILSKLENLDNPDFILACRAREWPDYALVKLGEVYSEQAVVFHLEPLNRAEAEGLLAEVLDVSQVGEVLNRMDVDCISELYHNPLTLEMMGKVARTDAHLPSSRSALFERVCGLLWAEHNEGRAADALRHLTTEQALDTAGALMAGLLLAGKEAIGLARPALVADSDIGLAHLSALIDPVAAGAIVRCKLFNSEGLYRAKPIHRVIAEFLGARWLSRQADNPRKQRRLLAQFQGSGRVPASFRGLHAWLTVHRDELAEDVITADPLGVMQYADTTKLTNAQLKYLLKSLQAIAQADPYFRDHDWKGLSAKSLMIEAMLSEVDAAIRSRDNVHLSSLLIESIRGTLLARSLQQTLCDVMLNAERTMHERYASALALKPLYKCDEWEDLIAALLLQIRRNSAELAYLIIEMLGFTINSELLVETTLARLGVSFCELPRSPQPQGHRLGEYSSLSDQLSTSELAPVLALLANRIDLVDARDFTATFEIHELVASLVTRAIAERVVTRSNPSVLWEWLGMLSHADRNGLAMMSLLRLLASDNQLRRAVQHHALFGDARRYIFLYQATILQEHLIELTADDHLHFMEYLATFSNQDGGMREDWQGLVDSAAYSCGIDQELRSASLKFEAGCSQLADFIERRIDSIAQSAASSREREELAISCERRKTLQERRSLRCYYRQHKNELRAGELPFIELPAKHYLGSLRLFHTALPALERLKLWCGKALTRDALIGFEAVLQRTDLPSAADVAKALAQNRHYLFNLPIFAALLCRLRRQVGFTDLSHDLLKTGLLLCYQQGRMPNDPDRYNLSLELEKIVLSTEYDREAFARLWIEPALQVDQSVIPGITRLVTIESWRSTTIVLAAEWLARAGSLNAEVEKQLFLFLLDSGESNRLLQIANARLYGRGSDPKIDSKWLALKVLIDFEDAQAQFADRLSAPEFIWKLRDVFTLERNRRLVEHSAGQAEWIVSQFRRFWPILPSDGRVRHQDDADEASRFIILLIERLSAETTDDACWAISRLVSEPSDSYSELLKHAQVSQRQKNTEEMFRPIEPEQLKLLLSGERPCNAEDLKTLIVEELAVVQNILQGDELDPVRMFWNDSEEPREENRCRDDLAGMLRSRLERYEVSMMSEVDMPENKRVDLAFRCGTIQLPLEVKGQWHSKVWHAASSQLDRQYLIDWRSDQRGIFCVLWFGTRVSQNSLPCSPPKGVETPTSAEEMRNALIELIPQERRSLIHVVVMDLTRSNRRQGICLAQPLDMP
ncbi:MULTISPECIES: NACHT domain-containing protein [unclassified Pseudomonas]|uniref:NACHT domain-containing protein n=1 Tax=unclassified Pseudomonas TaxID=196821 RepID=UPI001CBC087A|nr:MULTISPECIES: hypothetical protein [unclassified Pseudomonas]